MNAPVPDRCEDCAYKISAHAAKDGRFLGCPTRLASAYGQEHTLPRITVRVGKAGARKGRVFVTWPDHLDGDSGQIIVWDMGTGDHFTDDNRALSLATRRPDRDFEQTVREEVEYQIGGKVRIVGGGWGRATA